MFMWFIITLIVLSIVGLVARSARRAMNRPSEWENMSAEEIRSTLAARADSQRETAVPRAMGGAFGSRFRDGGF